MRQCGVQLRFVALGGVAAALGACQPTLEPVVPAGAAAYETMAVVRTQPVEYLLQPGDTISVLVFQEPDLTQEKMRIDRSGNLYLPLIGTVKAAGESPSDLARQIQHSYGMRYLRNPSVSVRLDETMRQTVSVEGEVALPGVYEIQPGQTLLSALAMARSPTQTAKLDQILIFRQIDGQRAGARFDLVAIRSGQADDPELLPGDVIVVGFSSLRGVYRDILQAAPLFNVFTVLGDGRN